MKNKKERTKKQIYTRFIIMVVVGSVVGFLAGFGGAFLTDYFEGDWLGGLIQISQIAVPIVYVLLMLLVYNYSLFNFHKAKQLALDWDGWNEEVIDEAEKKLTRTIEACNIMQVCNFFLYSASCKRNGKNSF